LRCIIPDRRALLIMKLLIVCATLAATSALNLHAELSLHTNGSQRDPDLMYESVGVEEREISGRGAQKLMIVSAQYGREDKISELPDLPSGVEGLFFTELTLTERRVIGASTGIGWTLVHRTYHLDSCCKLDTHEQYSLSVCNNKVLRGLMAAKFYKMNAHLLPELKTADLILWSDADELKKITKHWHHTTDPSVRATRLIGDADIIIGRHHQRSTVSAEVVPAAHRAAGRTGISVNKALEDMKHGIAFMNSQGFHDDCGLLHCGQFLFRPKSPNIHRAMKYWWEFAQKYTFRDQISAPWAFKSNRVKLTIPCKGFRVEGPCILNKILGIAM